MIYADQGLDSPHGLFLHPLGETGFVCFVPPFSILSHEYGRSLRAAFRLSPSGRTHARKQEITLNFVEMGLSKEGRWSGKLDRKRGLAWRS